MQSVSSRIWTRVAVSISYDDNDYTMGTSNPILGTDRECKGELTHKQPSRMDAYTLTD